MTEGTASKYAINLYDDDDDNSNDKTEVNDPTVIRRNALIASIIEGNVSVELIKNCEGCGEPLAKPMLITTDGKDSKDRDSSIFCDPCAK